MYHSEKQLKLIEKVELRRNFESTVFANVFFQDRPFFDTCFSFSYDDILLDEGKKYSIQALA